MKYTHILRVLLIAEALASYAPVLVEADDTLELRMVTYINPGGLDEDGDDCDLLSQCDHKFTFCLDSDTANVQTNVCSYLLRTTGEFDDQNRNRFEDDMEGVSNPLVFTFRSWPGRVHFKVEVVDDDIGFDDDVDKLFYVIRDTPAVDRSAAQLHSMRITGTRRSDPTTLDIQYRLYDTEECASNPCLNNGLCIEGIRSYSCNCSSTGFAGSRCGQEINECASNPCRSFEQCNNNINSYSCQCQDGFRGSLCEIDIDECASNPCLNNSQCMDGINSFSCDCVSGFTGSRCVEEVNECASNPCPNNGQCNDGFNSYSCQCPAGFTGSTCETNIDECASAPCQNNSQCFDQVNSFVCQCPPGFSGTHCDKGPLPLWTILVIGAGVATVLGGIIFCYIIGYKKVKCHG